MRDWTGAPEIQNIADFQARKVTERIDYFLRDLSRGIGRIQDGEVPDGSGTLISDVKISDIYWVLLGRSGGQTGFGGTGPSQNARIASTTDATKGLIYLGMADLAAFDETNTRLGMGTTAATAKVHIKVAPPSFVSTVRPQADVAAGTWVNTTGGGVNLYQDLRDQSNSTFIREIEGAGVGTYIASATATNPGTVSGWNVFFTAKKTGGGLASAQLNMDSGGASWFLSPNQGLSTTLTEYTFPVSPVSATAALFTNLRFGLAIGAGPGFGEVQVAEARLEFPAAGGVSDDLLQEWEAGASTATLNYGDSGASTVDMRFIGNMPVMRTNGDLSSGLRTYASASAFWVEAGTTAQSAMNLTFAGNRQATGVSAKFNFASATFASAVQVQQLGIGAAPSASPAIALDVTGRTRFAPVAQSFSSSQNNYDIGSSTVLRLTASNAALFLRGFTNGVAGRFVVVINGGTVNGFVLAHEAGGSSAANRFYTNTLQDIFIGLGDAKLCVYDENISRWRVFDWITPSGEYLINGNFTWNSTLTIDADSAGILLISSNIGGTGGPLVIFQDSGTSNTLTLQAPAIAGTSVLQLPDATDILVARNTTDTLASKTLAKDCKLYADTLLSGVSFVDFADNTKLLRFILSGSGSGVRSALQFSNTVAQIYHFMIDLGGIIPLVGDDDPGVQAGNLGKVDKIVQTANITTTNLSNGPPVGFYEVEVILMCTKSAVGAGTLAVVIGWTDNVGATTNTVITGFVLTATGRTTGRALLRVNSGDITYAVTVTGIYSTAEYAVYVRVIALG